MTHFASTTGLLTFPPTFLWGAATSAYQVEGSLTVDGRGESVWDTFSRVPGAIEGGSTAATASDSYLRWQDDVDLITGLGLNSYRFSVAWSRIMPDGTGRVEQRGLDHYSRFVDALLDRGIAPVLTLNHWDMPQALMATGGWVDRASVDRFAEFTTAVADRLGDRVEWWLTQNEPWVVSLLGYQLGLHAPGITDLRAAVTAGHHMLLAHGAGADVLHVHPHARVGTALSLFPCDSATESTADREAAHGSDGYVNRWYLDPLLGDGYPDDMREHYERALGGPLDFIRPGDEAAIGARSEFLGVNYYTRRVMAAAPVGQARPFPWRVVEPSASAAQTDEGWEIAPDRLRDLLLRIARDYPGTPVMVTENGAVYADELGPDGHVHDLRRAQFLHAHLRAVHQAIEGGADVLGYLHWSLLDNFEWALGYRPRFGLVHVDFASGVRTVKDSGRYYEQIARAGAAPAAPPVDLSVSSAHPRATEPARTGSAHAEL